MTPFALLMDFLTVLVALALVLGLAFFSIRMLKKVQSGAPSGDEIRFIRSLPLGARERATVVVWRDEVLLLGVTAGGITVLDRRARTAEEIAEDAARVEAASVQTAAVAARVPPRLRRWLGKSLAGERPDYRR
ncbi:MAG: flagellar biosynthetic protein FliO [Brevundimonas sp.]|jgi:flagellar biogenesis protein FliO|uniref:flagellar biosynthetic protein FliO n=1 Tax=Brevundimonas sp. TaxID=1871086 RepID=UPI0025C14710|nr:flagellar biosynthetic protein FliO [Brevundimonas sp.]MCH4267165.1 flagellar biosynthetic protein FliO [Brevundimonas sp.]